MKKIVFIAICVVGLVGFSSCGSTAPCGLSKIDKTKQSKHQSEIIVADATEIAE